MAFGELINVVLIVSILKLNDQEGNLTKTICSGTLIREDLVLTAAHCFPDHELINEVTIKLLSGISREAQGVHIHPNFNQSGSDLAVVVCFSTELKTFPDLPSVALGKFGNKSCQTLGYGSFTLTLDDLKVIDIDQNRIVPFNGFIGVIFSGNIPCKGDSGGPLICGGTIFGVLSKGTVESCLEKSSIAIYEDVFHHLNWLQPFFTASIAQAPPESNKSTIIIAIALFVFVLLIAVIVAYYLIDWES